MRKPPSKNAVTQLIAEVQENARRYLANIEQLKSLLYYMGDETWLTCPDWDWRWPEEVSMASVRRRHYAQKRWIDQVSPPLSQHIDDYYAVLADQPPSMEEWAMEWTGNTNTFYTFILAKLNELRDKVAGTADELTRSLQRLGRSDVC
jgi:hypothetical protein